MVVLAQLESEMEVLVAIIGTFQVLFLVGLWNQARLLRKLTERVLGCETEIKDLWKEDSKNGIKISEVEKRVLALRAETSQLIDLVKVLDQRTQKTIVFTPNRKKP